MRRDGLNYELKIWLLGDKMDDNTWQQLISLYLERLLGKYKRIRFGNTFYRLYKTFLYKHTFHDTVSLRQLGNSFHAVLYNEGKPMAFMAGYVDHKCKRVVVPRLAIDFEYKFYSPGYVLIDQTMRHVAKETTIREIDLSRGTERYKTDMGGVVYHTLSFVFKNR